MAKNSFTQWLLFFLYLTLVSIVANIVISLGWSRLLGNWIWETFGQLNGHYIMGTLWVFFREALSSGTGIYAALRAVPNKKKGIKVLVCLWSISAVLTLIGIAILIVAAKTGSLDSMQALDSILYGLAYTGAWGTATFIMREAVETNTEGDFFKPRG